MNCLILAAGRGTRLMPMTNNIPKPLIEVGGKSLIEYQIEALRAVGIEKMHIVIGYKGEMLREHLEDEKIEIIENEKYDTTSSLESLYLAKDYLKGREFVLINGDLIFDSKKIKPIQDYYGKNATLAESKKEYEKNEMNMISKDGMIKKISKNLNPDECDAQSLQISLFSKRGSQILFDVAPKKIETGGKFPADAFDEIIEQDVMYKVERNKGFWFEIDDHDDLECARKELS